MKKYKHTIIHYFITVISTLCAGIIAGAISGIIVVDYDKNKEKNEKIQYRTNRLENYKVEFNLSASHLKKYISNEDSILEGIDSALIDKKVISKLCTHFVILLTSSTAYNYEICSQSLAGLIQSISYLENIFHTYKYNNDSFNNIDIKQVEKARKDALNSLDRFVDTFNNEFYPEMISFIKQ